MLAKMMIAKSAAKLIIVTNCLDPSNSLSSFNETNKRKQLPKNPTLVDDEEISDTENKTGYK